MNLQVLKKCGKGTYSTVTEFFGTDFYNGHEVYLYLKYIGNYKNHTAGFKGVCVNKISLLELLGTEI